MPYIITTSAPWGESLGARNKYAATSRRAYATLADAQYDVDLLIEDHGGSIDEHPDVLDDGGSIGPLPDGTVIEVAPASYFELRDMAGLAPGNAYAHMDAATTRRNVLDAFNAS